MSRPEGFEPLRLTDGEREALWQAISRPSAAPPTMQRPLLVAIAAGFCLFFQTPTVDRGAPVLTANDAQVAAIPAKPAPRPRDEAPLGSEAAPLAPVTGRISTTLRLADGSTISPAPAAELVVQKNSATALALVQQHGFVHYDVTPGGVRAWNISAGGVAIAVIGTAFTVNASEHAVDVSVEHGIVVVTGPGLPRRRLADGQSVHVATDAPRPAPSAQDEATTSNWRGLANGGAYQDAYRALGPDGVTTLAGSRFATAADLAVAADAARLSGHPKEASVALRALIQHYPADPGAPLAAFTLGRLLKENEGDLRGAATAFQRALDLGVTGSLREAAYLRRIEALDLAGEATDSTIDAYLADFPGGIGNLGRWLKPATPPTE